ncbi:uncharacterized protein LOC118477126 [Aplysia californica]|uniref:Uncharacterized protein LOC118477126 n=1 Tax=Aplysia californica TaxID=6500 RepID=A0ABM1VSM6_APLCA|nr:uncharacterized protein LOC118477126 [Aplysia californica]
MSGAILCLMNAPLIPCTLDVSPRLSMEEHTEDTKISTDINISSESQDSFDERTKGIGLLIKAADKNMSLLEAVNQSSSSNISLASVSSSKPTMSKTKDPPKPANAIPKNVYRPGQLPGRTKTQLQEFRASLGVPNVGEKAVSSVTDKVLAVTVDPSLILDSDAPKKRGRGRPRKHPAPFKRKVNKSYSYLKKKTKIFPVRVESKDKGAEIEALEKIDSYSMALEMGYSDPHMKSNSDSQCSKDPASDPEEEEVSKKTISPVENIQQVIDYMINCGCACLLSLSVQDIALHRFKLTTMERQPRDFFIMGLLCSSVVSSTKTTTNHIRQRNTYHYRFRNIRICQVCFLFVNNIREKYMKRLKKHFLENGPEFRTHGNQGRKPHNALRTDDVSDVVDFILKYAAIQGVPAPRPPKNAKARRVVRLPSTDTFTSVYKQYKELCNHTGKKELGLTSFKKIWNSQVGHVKVSQKNSPKDGSSCAQASMSGIPGKDDALKRETARKKKETEKGEKRQRKVRDMPLKKARLNPQNQEDSMQPPQPVSLPFDLNAVDMPQTPIMSFSMYLNEGAGNVETPFQHNMLMPHSSMPHPHHHVPQGGMPHPPHPHLDNGTPSSSPRPHMQSMPSALPPPSAHPLTAHTSGPGNLPQRNFPIPGQPFLPSSQAGLHSHQWYMQ